MPGSDEKTEKPTPRRLEEARKRGQVAKSTDLNSALVLGAIVLILMLYGGHFIQYLSRLIRELLWHQLRNAQALTEAGFIDMFQDIVFHSALIMLPFLLGTLLIGVFANVCQIRFLFTLEPLKPTFSKLNPLEGFKKLFSQRALVELAKGILKMAMVAACGYWIIQSHREELLGLGQMGFSQAWYLLGQVIIQICAAVAVALFILGLADWWYQRYQLMKQLRMSRQEIKDEMKNTEGNPEIKRKIKSAGQAMLRQKMLKSVANADVVVTNPTHISVAIQYDPDVAPAPRLVAKGADHMAFKIRELAKENGVPMVENVPLARGLYAMVEVGHMIPPELFIAVAEVLAYVFKRSKGRRKSHMRKLFESGVGR